jgi:hypothetical protein
VSNTIHLILLTMCICCGHLSAEVKWSSGLWHCTLVGGYWCFRGKCCLHVQGCRCVLLVPRNSSRGRGVIPFLAELGEQFYQLTSAWVLPVWNVASWSVVRCIVRCVVSVGNVIRSGSSSESHHSKRTALRAPQQRLPFRAAKVMRQ